MARQRRTEDEKKSAVSKRESRSSRSSEREEPESFLVRTDLAGVDPDDVKVTVADGVLTISGERSSERRHEDEGFVRTERSFGSFYRAIPLPDDVDEEHISASAQNGILEIVLPLKPGERERGRRIAIETRDDRPPIERRNRD